MKMRDACKSIDFRVWTIPKAALRIHAEDGCNGKKCDKGLVPFRVSLSQASVGPAKAIVRPHWRGAC